VGRAEAVAAFGQSRVRVVLPLLKTGARIMDARDSGARGPSETRAPSQQPAARAQQSRLRATTGLTIRHQANRQRSQARSLEAG
jgi:hypothetical protein